MTTFEQRLRDAKTILEARWLPHMPELTDGQKDLVAVIMLDYAVQCELAILRERVPR
jgi:hypothetical protein